MRAMIVFLGLSISIFSQALRAVEIDDFMWNLERLDKYFASLSFNEALSCGTKASFQVSKDMCKLTCQGSGFFTVCEMYCIPPHLKSDMVTVEVVNCKEDEATLFSSDGDVRTITKSDFLKYQKNPMRELIANLPNWIEGVHRVTLLRMEKKKHTLGWKTKNERTVDAWYLEGSVAIKTSSGAETTEDMIFTLITDGHLPWFARAARVRLREDGSMWRLHDL
jgi:hypothetical protein